VAFTAGSANGSTITNYIYSTDGGSTYTACSPSRTASPLIITGLTNGSIYYIKIAAVNGVGIGSVSGSVVSAPSAPAAPSAPTFLTAAAGDTQVAISFTAGSINGSAITNYQYSTDGGSNFTAFSTAQTASPVTISGLANGTSYTIKLKAVNANGVGTASASVIATPAGPPGAPTSLVAVPGTGKATVVFVADVIAANYMYSIDGGATYTACSPAQTSSPVVISGLTNGTTYTVNLKGVNAYGTGPAAATAATVVAGSAPDAPTALAATVSDSSVQIAFTEGDANGYAITSHQYSLDGGVNYTSFFPAQATSPVTITGLTNGTKYAIKLKSINLLGIGAGSSAVSVTPAGVSGVPTGLVVAATSNTTATLSFTAGTSSGGTVTNYKVSTTGVNGTFTALSPAYTASPIPLSGLTPGATYSISLQEVTTGGTSAASAAVALTLTVPDAVTGLTATTETGQTSVSFTSSGPAGAAITNYAYSLNGGSTYTVFSPAQTSSPVFIGNLIDGVSYTIKLEAVNALGVSGSGDSVVITPVSPETEPVTVAVDNTATITLATTYNGETVVKYWYSIDDGINWIDPTNTIVIENLSNGVDYSMWYYAVTYTGTSPTYVANVSPTQGAPSAPTIVTITPATDGTTLSVAFTAPASTGTSAITNYTYTTNNGSLYTVFNPVQMTSPLTISNTALGATYYVAIAAINGSGVGDTSAMVTVMTFVPCFARGTKIRTDKGYRCIETLRPGDMVETLKHKYVPIHTIGRRAVIPPRYDARTPDHLYLCSPNAYKEVFEDLVMTGYHARLQRSLLPPMEAKVRALYDGKVFTTEDMYRVPICLDDRATVFIPDTDAAAEFDIYNFALEADDRYVNYGVYANGLLVESTSIRYMLELSQMEFMV
jgi:titin